MGKMPEDRHRRMQSIFRRFGIPGDSESDPQEGRNEAPEAEPPRARDILLPGEPSRDKKAERPRPGRI